VSERRWKGISGRAYHELGEIPVREGPVVGVQAALACGQPCGVSYLSEGAKVAVRIRRSRTKEGRNRFALETTVFAGLSHACPDAPCPRLIEKVDDSGEDILVTEWCPGHLEDWWTERTLAGDGLEQLWSVIADLCKRVADCRRHLPSLEIQGWVVPDLRPRSILRTTSGKVRIGGFHQWGQMLQGSGDSFNTSDAFMSPEELFESENVPSEASDVWALGTLILLLLRMRGVMKATGSLPRAGSDAPVFLSHRSTLIRDLHARKPKLFLGRILDSRQFLYPDRLPDQDRQNVALALTGAFDAAEPVLEKQLAKEVCRVLTKALMVDPLERYPSVLDFAAELDDLGERFRSLSQQTVNRPERSEPVDERTDKGTGWTGTQPIVVDGNTTMVVDEEHEHEHEHENEPAAPQIMLYLLLGSMLAFGLAVAGLLLWINAQEIPEQALAPALAPALGPAPISVSPAAVRAGDVVVVEQIEPRIQPVSSAAEPAPSVDQRSQQRGVTGLVTVSGADAFLVGSSGPLSIGRVPPGEYRLFARLNGPAQPASEVASVRVVPGEEYAFRCGFGVCRSQ
jgi:serine/threonine protein kinase